jgi:hypothetical protein
MSLCKGDPARLTATREAMKQHLYMVRMERRSYHVRRALPTFDSSVFSIVIDGADQSGFDLPHFAQETHSSQKGRIGVKVMGSIAHGHGRITVFCYHDKARLPF